MSIPRREATLPNESRNESGRRRLTLSCPHRPPCPGCPRFGEPGVDAEAFAALAKLADSQAIAPPQVFEGPGEGFRSRARLAIRGRANSPKIGIFETGTHRVVHIPNCVVHHPLINEVAEVVRSVLAAQRVPPYSDAPHAGLARYLQVAIERTSQTAQVVLVANSETHEPLIPTLDAIAERLGSRLHGLFWNGNNERTNAILGERFWQHSGSDMLRETFGGPSVFYPPGAFGQSNLELSERIIEHVARAVPDGARVSEFYCGVGAIGLSLLPRVSRLALNEISGPSLQGLERGILELSDELGSKATVQPGNAESARDLVVGSNAVIVDPPRKGLDAGLLAALIATPPEKLIYVSCGLSSFLRDSEQLLAQGCFKLTELSAYALFPFTQHVETLAIFEKR